MKHHILSILFGALSVILTACSSDITPEPDVPSAKGESILCLDIQKQDLTRGIITSTSFEKGDSVFVVVTDAQHPDPLTFTSAAVYNGNEWILKEKIDLSAETYGIGWSSATVEVYYPYETFFQAFNPRNQTMIIMENPLDQEDILYGKATGINAENPSAKVSCGHLKSRLSFEFRNNSDSPVGITKMSVTTEGDQLFLGRYGYISNGYFNIPDEYTKDFAMNCNIEIAAGETATLDLLIPPTEEAYEMMEEKMELDGISKTTLKFSLDAGSRTVNFDIDAQPWAPGKQYIYPVRIDSETNWKSIITNGDANNGPSENCLVYNDEGKIVEASVVDNPSGEGKVFSAPIIAQEEGDSGFINIPMYIKFNQSIEEGTELKVSFNYYCTDERSIMTLAFGVGNQYFNYHTWGILGSLEAKPEWKSIEKTFTVTVEQAGGDYQHFSNDGLQVIGFHFPSSPDSGMFYINNIKVEAFLEGKK